MRKSQPVAMTPLARTLARTGFAEDWYRWCDADRDWSAEATRVYDVDALRTERGSFAALDLREFMDAFLAAGAEVSKGSTFPGQRHRSFTATVAVGARRSVLAIRLGRGLNSLECNLAVFEGERQVGEAELLHVIAYDIRRARGDDAAIADAPYPRPIIGSRSQLEVVSREIVDALTVVVRERPS